MSSSRDSEAPKRRALVPRHTQALRAEVRAGRPRTAHPNASFCSQSCCSRGEGARCRWDGSFCRLGGSVFPSSALRAPQRGPSADCACPVSAAALGAGQPVPMFYACALRLPRISTIYCFTLFLSNYFIYIISFTLSVLPLTIYLMILNLILLFSLF